MQRYLVPLDGSDLAEHSLRFAKERARRLDGTITLVRVVDVARRLVAMSGGASMEGTSPLMMHGMEDAVNSEIAEAKSYLTKMTEDLQKEGYEVSWEVREGPPATEIVKCAKERDIDVIVISTHGRSGLGRLVFGSVAEQVIRDGRVPVLVINP
ncbi:MAG: universal stress protein [Chloroflexi bacterium]|nr:universal stress protein [Chloroflexota bacterium]